MTRALSRLIAMLCLLIVMIAPARADWELEDFAGGGPHLLPATQSNLDRPTSVARDATGVLYVLLNEPARIYRITPSGVLEIAFVPGTETRIDDVVGWPFDIGFDSTGRLNSLGE